MNMNHPSDTARRNYPPTEPGQHSHIVVKILCIFAAFCLWVYVMMVESPEYKQTFTHITVELINQDSLNENEVAIYSGYGTMIDVTLSGKKSTISKLTENDIVVTADLSTIASGTGRVNCKIDVDVPAGCQLVGISQDTISVYLDKADQKLVTLTEQRDNIRLPDGCYMGAVEFSVDNVSVSGPVTYLNRVEKAVVQLDLTGITDTTTLTEKVYLVDAYGKKIENQYLEYEPKEVTVEIPVLKSVTVPIEIIFKHGYLSSENADISVVPQSVEITGEPEVIDHGNLLSAIEIDEKTDFDGDTFAKTIELEAPEGTTLSVETVEVSVTMDPSIITRRITVPGENIEDTGGKSGVEYTWDKSPVIVTIMGKFEDISRIDAEDITLKLDMSPYTSTNTGTIRVRAEVDVDSPYKDAVLEVGTYDINVTFLN